MLDLIPHFMPAVCAHSKTRARLKLSSYGKINNVPLHLERAHVFDSDFLTPQTATLYQELIAQTARIVATSLPSKPYTGLNPAALAELIPSSFLPGQSCPPEQIAVILQSVVANSLCFSHPNIVAHLHTPPLLAAIAAELVITSINQSMDSFDLGPLATVAEQKLVRWLCAEAGLPSTSEGTLTTGGSQSNYLGLLLARNRAVQKHWNWSAQKSGLPPEARKLRILCSDVAHFTVDKSASQLGLGSDAVIRIPVDAHFQMDATALGDALHGLQAEGLVPMAIVATAGTTDFGSVDPLPEIADLARQFSAWLHVDGAYGGALLFSKTHRGQLRGIESADSFSMDFHKLFWQPIPSAVFMLLDARHFDSIKLYADYLNPKLNEEEGIPDLVTTSIMTSRRFDALKVWICFQTLGRAKLTAMIDRTFELAVHAAGVIRRSEHLELLAEPKTGSVVFRYLSSKKDANPINDRIPKHLFTQGVAIIGHTRVKDRQCLKFTFMNPSTTEAQVEDLIMTIVREGRTIEDADQSQ